MVLENVTLPIVLGTAFIDSINPCAIGVLLLLLSVLMQNSEQRKKLVLIATIYISVVFLVYILSGLGLIAFQTFLISKGFSQVVGIIIGILVIIGALIEIKDFWWYGKGISLSISKKHSKMLMEKVNNLTIGGTIFFGAFAAIVELPCTGGPYLAITALLAQQFDFAAFMYLVIYNIVFVLPLIVITILAVTGMKLAHIENWKKEKRKWMRLWTGIVMLLLGIFLLWYYIGGF